MIALESSPPTRPATTPPRTLLSRIPEHADEAAEKDDVVQREDPPRSQQQPAHAQRIHRLDAARHYVPHPTGTHRATGPYACA
jgi:hypothetical protein